MPNTTATLSVEDHWGLPVVENTTNLATSAPRASAMSSRPASCPARLHGFCDYGSWRVDGDGFTYDREWDRCSCGISWDNIPGPTCEYTFKPAPYWGTGYNGCYCWCIRSGGKR